MGFRSGEVAGQSSTPTPWSFNQLLVPLAVWAGANPAGKWNSILKAGQQKEAWSAPKFLGKQVQVTLVFQKHNGPTPADEHCHPKSSQTVGNLTLDFMQLGLWASPPFLQTLGPWFPMKYKTCSHLKRGLWTTGQQSSLLLLSPGKTPLMLSVVQEWLNKRNTTTVAKFLDTSVCGGSWCIDPASVHPCEVHPSSWIDFAWQSS